MFPQGNVLNNDNIYPLGVDRPVRTEKTKDKTVEKPIEKPIKNNNTAMASSPERAGDIITISENGSIDLTMFNFIDKGGDASKALNENSKEEAAFAPKPNFIGISISRYNEMKAEIERNFSYDDDAKNKYLQELDKALNDYISLQAKIAESLDSGKKRSPEEDGGRGNAEAESEEIAKLKQMYQAGSKEVKAIIEKVLGNKETSNSEEANKFVDDFFVDVYKQKMDFPKKTGMLGQEVDPEIKKIWEAVRFHIDSE